MTVKKAISLRDDVYKSAREKADKLFGGNFSAYIGYLISKDREGEAITVKPVQEEKNDEIMSAIDEILEI